MYRTSPVNFANNVNDADDLETVQPDMETSQLLQHETTNAPNLPEIEVFPSQNDSEWRGIPFKNFSEQIGNIYDEITRFRKNLFKIPTGKAGKAFVAELCFWLHEFNIDGPLNSIALKTFMVLPTLLLQKPSARSKAKDHSECLQRRLEQGRYYFYRE